MRHYKPALREQLFRYVKRKNLRLDGSVPGAQSARYRPGLRYALPPLPSGYGSSYSSGAPDFYTVSSAAHQLPGMHYRPPMPWFIGMPVGTTPQLRTGPGPGAFAGPLMPDGLGGDDSLVELVENPLEVDVPTLFEQPMADQVGGPDIPRHVLGEVLLLGAEEPGGAIRFTSDVPADPDEMGAPDPMADHPWYGQTEMSQEMFEEAMAAVDEFGGMPEAMENQTAGVAEFGPGLEGMLHEAAGLMAAQADPSAMYGAEMTDPYADQRAMYDDQMQMLMDPWMMPGPMGPGAGFGPMGPMPDP